MSGFRTHLRVAIWTGIVGSSVVYLTSLESGLAMIEATAVGAAAFVLAVITGILPDVDVQSSIPRRLFGKGGLGVAGVGSVGYTVLNPSILDPLIGVLLVAIPDLPSPRIVGMILVGGIALAGATAFGSLFDDVTVHRGFLHNPSLGIVLGIAAGVALLQFGVRNPLVVAVFAFVVTVGFLAHLATDKLN